MFQPCIVVPFFNHEGAIERTLASVKNSGLVCWLVDDGSDPHCAPLLDALAAREGAWLQLIRYQPNQGKGVAVMAGCAPAGGVISQTPAHEGAATLTFEPHNLQTYSEGQVGAQRAFARYTAPIGVLPMDNTLISRAVVQNEFRTIGDLVDRVGGGAGPGGVKAVAPDGRETITVMIPEVERSVSLLGEKLAVARMDGTAAATKTGQPIAVVSSGMLE